MADHIPPLATLGRRIMVLGLTNSGKSTLAVALSDRLGVPPIHLDQLQHRPNTNWEQRPEAEFAALHDAAILAPEWIVDGSYSRVMPQRLARATGIIVVTDSLVIRYRRYFARTLFQKVRETPEWKDFMAKGAFSQSFMSGDEFKAWVANAETQHKDLMTKAGFLAE